MSADRPEEPGRLRPLTPSILIPWGLVGLVLGWGWRRVLELFNLPVAVTSGLQIGLLALVAVILIAVARRTRETISRRRPDLPTNEAVNRLALGRASALAGTLALGFYLGHALSWVGLGSELATQRIALALLGAAAAGAVVTGGVMLERACRTPTPPDQP